jgi:hypothetical protein
VACADYGLHERLLDCNHADPVMVLVRLDDGCSGRLCQACDGRLGTKRWPGLAERIAGPARGLDVLEMLRAAARRPPDVV